MKTIILKYKNIILNIISNFENKEEFIKLLNFKINSSLKLKESIKLSKQIEKNKINKFLLKQYKNTVDHNTLFSKADSSSKINLCK